MASKVVINNIVVKILVLMSMVWARSVAQQPDCNNVLISMAPCLNYVSGSSPTPTSSCCSQLANVVQKDPECLCVVLNGGGASLGININKTLALALPSACNVQTPPISRCDVANGPATSIGSPEGLLGSKIPVTGGSSSSMGLLMKMPLLLHFVLLVVFNYIAIYAST